jgi:DNA-binding transcriptional MerR regulator
MSKKARNYTKIDEHNYAAIKKLIEAGLTGKEIQKAMGIAPSTFWRIKASASLDEYRHIVNTKNAAQAQKRAEAKTEGEKLIDQIAQAERAMVEINFTEAQAEVIIEVLNDILRKVSIIADNTKPKGLFR